MKKEIFLVVLLVGIQAYADHLIPVIPAQEDHGKETVSASALARKTCITCGTDHSTVTDPATQKESPNPSPQKIVTCANGHITDVECVADSLKAQSNVLEVEQKGLTCCAEGCKSNLPLSAFIDLLEPGDCEAFVTRIEKAKAGSGPSAPDERKKQREIEKLQDGLESAFNRFCPMDGCGSTFDQIEGCNAGTCSNEECQAKFCYLCMKPQKDNNAAHAHVREHSGNYWEQRPGYAERYEWLLAREKLAHLFHSKIPDSIRSEALESRRALLAERNMWPMPAGLTAEEWIKQIEASDLSLDKKIAMLQNEYIFRSRKEDRKNASRVEAELRKLGVKVLASLDVKDAGGIPAPGSAVAASAPVRARAPVHIAAAAAALPVVEWRFITPVLEGHDDPRVRELYAQLRDHEPAFFAYGGNHGRLYVIQDPENRVRPFVLSDAVGEADQYHAAELCPAGTRLPTREELVALSRAMSPGGRYDRNIVPEISGTEVWSSCIEYSATCGFNGYTGYIYFVRRHHVMSVRCILPLAAW